MRLLSTIVRSFSVGSAKIARVRGMRDMFQMDCKTQKMIVSTATTCAESYGYEEISTPIVESLDVFSRTLGEDSDVVSKEMFTFTDLSGRTLALRPENTAGVIRAVGSIDDSTNVRVWYCGPMFRYERPQSGRYRQFTQFGVESIGCAAVTEDASSIALAHQILENLGLIQTTKLLINTIGDRESRLKYRQVLQTYFQSHASSLSEDSKKRLERGSILRILDSKDTNDRGIIQNAPRITENLTHGSAERFEQLLQMLEALKIKYEIDTTLVRGLDYYEETTFEFVTEISPGNTCAVVAGGRYDLGNFFCGKSLPSVGWALGVDRIANIFAPHHKDPTNVISVLAISQGNREVELRALQYACNLRKSKQFCVHLITSSSFKKAFKKAASTNSCICVVLGEDEIKNHLVTLKNMMTSEQQSVPEDDFPHAVTQMFNNQQPKQN